MHGFSYESILSYTEDDRTLAFEAIDRPTAAPCISDTQCATKFQFCDSGKHQHDHANLGLVLDYASTFSARVLSVLEAMVHADRQIPFEHSRIRMVDRSRGLRGTERMACRL